MLKRNKIKKKYYNAHSLDLSQENITNALCALAFGYDVVEKTDVIRYSDPIIKGGPLVGTLAETRIKTTTVAPNLQALAVAQQLINESQGNKDAKAFEVLDPYKEIAKKMAPLLQLSDG